MAKANHLGKGGRWFQSMSMDKCCAKQHSYALSGLILDSVVTSFDFSATIFFYSGVLVRENHLDFFLRALLISSRCSFIEINVDSEPIKKTYSKKNPNRAMSLFADLPNNATSEFLLSWKLKMTAINERMTTRWIVDNIRPKIVAISLFITALYVIHARN